MEKLISLVEYCQEVSKEFIAPKKPFDKNEWFGKILNYSDFLKQPLTLGMFVPCFTDGTVFSKFQLEILDSEDLVTELREAYKQAKERVLFKDCGIMDDWFIQFHDGYLFCNIHNIVNYTMEDLAQYNLELSQSVIKQFWS